MQQGRFFHCWKVEWTLHLVFIYAILIGKMPAKNQWKVEANALFSSKRKKS